MAGWNSIKCDILSDPMHAIVAMVAKNYVGQNVEIEVVKYDPHLLARLNFALIIEDRFNFDSARST